MDRSRFVRARVQQAVCTRGTGRKNSRWRRSSRPQTYPRCCCLGAGCYLGRHAVACAAPPQTPSPGVTPPCKAASNDDTTMRRQTAWRLVKTRAARACLRRTGVRVALARGVALRPWRTKALACRLPPRTCAGEQQPARALTPSMMIVAASEPAALPGTRRSGVAPRGSR